MARHLKSCRVTSVPCRIAGCPAIECVNPMCRRFGEVVKGTHTHVSDAIKETFRTEVKHFKKGAHKSLKQAKAIALSKLRKAGFKIPKKRKK